MITDFAAKNFRCFDEISLKSLCPVNVLVGENGSGKSALLEAILLALKGSPSVVGGILNAMRNAPVTLPFGQMPAFQAYHPGGWHQMWKNLFREGTAEDITISFVDAEENHYQLEISYQSGQFSVPGMIQPIPTSQDLDMRQVRFDRTKNDIRTALLAGWNPQIGMQVLEVSPNRDGPTSLVLSGYGGDLCPGVFFFPPTLNFSESDNVEWFSKLSAAGKESDVVAAITELFPFVSGVQLLSLAGSPSLWLTTANGRKRPASFISAGLQKVVSIFLGAASMVDGIVLIDEIENGIYYKRYPDVWRALLTICKRNRNQLFVSSHSAECLSALSEAMAERPNDCMLLQAKLEGRDGAVVRQVAGDAMKDALAGEQEIRG